MFQPPQNGTAEALSAHTSTETNNGFVLFVSLAGQDEGLLVQNICIAQMQWGSFQQLDLGTQLTMDPGLPSCWNLEAWTPQATALGADPSPLPLTHTHAVDGLDTAQPVVQDPCVPTHFPQSLFYTQMSLSDSSMCHGLYSSCPGLPVPALSLQDSALPVLSPGSQATSPTCQLVQCALC